MHPVGLPDYRIPLVTVYADVDRFRYIVAQGVVESVTASSMVVALAYGRRNSSPRVEVPIAADLWRNEEKENDMRLV